VPATANADQFPKTSHLNRNVLLAVAVVAVSLTGLVWSTRRTENETQTSGQVVSTVHLETFVLNLADPGQRAYARVGIDLGLGRTLRKGENPPVAELRDTIIEVLGQGKADDLLTAKGKAQLKQDLLRALQQRAPTLDIADIYFTEFLIQR
jgi:flagellar basal body-associated protein FliL